MPPKNPWYLITSDEIDTIRTILQEQYDEEDMGRDAIRLLDTTRSRRP